MDEERELSRPEGGDEGSPSGAAMAGAGEDNPSPGGAVAAAAARPTGPGSHGWRAEKKERTRRVLVEVALELFERNGYDGTSVEEVAAAGGVSPRTVFRYFPAKHDLLFDDLPAAIAFLRRAIAERPPTESNFEVMRAMAVDHADAMADPVMLRRISLIYTNPSLRAKAFEVRELLGYEIGDALAERDEQLDPGVARLYGQVGALAVSRAMILWLDTGTAGGLTELTEQAFDSLRALVD